MEPDIPTSDNAPDDNSDDIPIDDAIDDAEAVGAAADPVRAALEHLGAEVATLRDQFERKLLADRQQQQLYDKLYQHLEFAQSDLTKQFIAPIARELLLVLDRIDALRGADTGNGELDSVREELTEILVRRGVREVDAIGEPFDPRVHQAVGRVGVSDPAQARVVVEQRRPGYVLGDYVLRPAEVVVGTAE